MGIRLGNLTIAEVERKHQFTLADDVRLELESMRQDDAQKIGEDKFHVFDLPITMFYCGSEQTRDHVVSLLIGYNSSIEGKLGVGFEEEVKEDE